MIIMIKKKKKKISENLGRSYFESIYLYIYIGEIIIIIIIANNNYNIYIKK